MLTCLRSDTILAKRVEEMTTSAQRARGLLKFSEAPSDYAAVFSLPFMGFFPTIHTWGMKFSIHIVFCDRRRIVQAIYPNTPPKRIVVPFRFILGGIAYVIEIPQGPLSANVLSLAIGDELAWGGS